MRAIRLWLLSPMTQACRGSSVGGASDATGGLVANVSLRLFGNGAQFRGEISNPLNGVVTSQGNSPRPIQFDLKRIW